MTQGTGKSLSSFDEWYTRNATPLYGYILTIVQHRHDADDILQTLCIRFFSNAELMAKLTTNAPYLYRAARNECLQLIRQRARAPQRTAMDFLNLLEAGDANSSPQREDARAMNTLLAKLPDEQREVVMLRIYNDMTLEEIAEIAAASVSTVHKRYQTGMQKLREWWPHE